MSACAPIDVTPAIATETSLVEVVLAACEWSEDPLEIGDLVDSLVAADGIRVVSLLPR